MKKLLSIFFIISYLPICNNANVVAQQAQWDWAQSFGANGSDKGNAICSDKNGNIYISGGFSSSIAFGNTALNASGPESFFIAKFNPNGNNLWAKTLLAGWYVRGYDICCDTACNVYAIGVFNSGIVSATDTIMTYGDNDVFLIKYDSTGIEQWLNQIGGIANDISLGGIAADISGNVYCTGRFYSPQLFVCDDTLFSNGSSDIFLVKYNNNGNLVWELNEGGISSESGNGLIIDGNNNIYIAGKFRSQTINFGTTVLANPTTSTSNFFLAKYNYNGEIQWAKQAFGNNRDEGWSIVCDSNNNVVVVCNSVSDSISFDSVNYIIPTILYEKIYIAKYDSSGNVLWVQSPVDHSQSKTGICLDNSNNIYISGRFKDSFYFGNITLSGVSARNCYVAKYNPSGVAQWALSSFGSLLDEAYGICSNVNNNLYITGYMRSPYVAFGSDTVYNSSLNDSDVFLAKILNQISLTDTQQIALPQGWKIFSTYINPFEPAVDSVFSDILPELIIMKEDVGNIYYPQYFINTIGNLEFTEGYHIKMSSQQTLNVIGYAAEPENTPMPLPS
ncbi:MAG: SBBP repeat-containing protein, partial [Bacteroidota bacterium]|nr:SBBP repeat-containing protein [Bacteroidota bacterium]